MVSRKGLILATIFVALTWNSASAVECIDNDATTVWYCGVKGNDESGKPEIVAITYQLSVAQQALGESVFWGQAIFKMTGETPGKFDDLPNRWNGGDMFHWGDDDVRNMQRACREACPPPPTTTTKPTPPPLKCKLFSDPKLMPNRPGLISGTVGNAGKNVSGAAFKAGPDAMVRECTDACAAQGRAACRFVQIYCHYKNLPKRIHPVFGFPVFVFPPTTYWGDSELSYCECYYRTAVKSGPKRFDQSWYMC